MTMSSVNIIKHQQVSLEKLTVIAVFVRQNISLQNVVFFSFRYEIIKLLNTDTSTADTSSIVFIECTKNYCLSEGKCVPIGSASDKIA